MPAGALMNLLSSSCFSTFLLLAVVSGIFYPVLQAGTISVKRKISFLDLFFLFISLILNLLSRRNSGCKSLFFEVICNRAEFYSSPLNY